ncbi:hypothetical protein PYCCODRAFT_265470 [Trametes coccinea BRFM310]|uniref:Uncharacterized protein n=1 Tax=Trametes coccinea (strain BRFM310) TaxID=1353009 RepID=A0A1Y2IT14_TRAC3|nr:hypothetical protein PYCCODRAFT_265470 [Trametes coccinea BRFM310]
MSPSSAPRVCTRPIRTRPLSCSLTSLNDSGCSCAPCALNSHAHTIATDLLPACLPRLPPSLLGPTRFSSPSVSQAVRICP